MMDSENFPRQFIQNLCDRWGKDDRFIFSLARQELIGLYAKTYDVDVIAEGDHQRYSFDQFEFELGQRHIAELERQNYIDNHFVPLEGRYRDGTPVLVTRKPISQTPRTITRSDIFAHLEDVELLEKKYSHSLFAKADREDQPHVSNCARPMMTEQGEELNPAERKSLLKLVYVMAVKGYSYNPEDRKSSVPREIEEDAASLDISITDDTIRKWLKEAVRLKQTDL